MSRALALVALVGFPALAGCFIAGPDAFTDDEACTFASLAFDPPVGPASARVGSSTATIRVDTFGIADIYAEDAYSLFYANGYVQARDRLFQMDVLRHVAYGDSASVLGASQLASDVQVRRDLYTRDEIVDMVARAPAWMRDATAAYADGVNRWLAEATTTASLPGEFGAIAHVPEPWTREDSAAITAYLVANFGVFGGAELENARIYAALEDSLGDPGRAHAALADINGVEATRTTGSIAPADKSVSGCEKLPRFDTVPEAQLAAARAAVGATPWGMPADVLNDFAGESGVRRGRGILEDFKWGSNALIVDGAHSATGLPVMFGGPQMAYFKPPIPYEIGLHGAGFDVRGIGVAGVPGVVIGRTPTFAWSVTSGYDDAIDTVVLELDPADHHRFKWGDAWETMVCRDEVHRVTTTAASPAPPRIVHQDACRAHGMAVIAWNEEQGLAWAQRATTRGREFENSARWLLLGRATNMAEFTTTLAPFEYSFNFHYAGADGIAYVHTGRIPLRADGIDPRLPALSGDAFAWLGTVGGAELGTIIMDPARGYVVNWNNPPTSGWRVGDMPYTFQGLHRVDLLERLVERALAASGDALTLADVEGILRDAATHDAFAYALAPHSVEAARADGDAALAPLADALEAWGLTDYAWLDADGDGTYDSPGHAVWDAARAAFQERVMRDELGPATRRIGFDPSKQGGGNGNIAAHGGFTEDGFLLNAIEGSTVHPWCDDVSTPVIESCADMLVAALEDARVVLAETYGTGGASTWREPVHHNRFMPIGASRADEIVMVNRGSWNQAVAIGQGLEGARGILPPGNSGHIAPSELLTMTGLGGAEPARLTDQLDLYTSFGFKPLPVTADEVASVAVSGSTLIIP